jgi:hypothetical protein
LSNIWEKILGISDAELVKLCEKNELASGKCKQNEILDELFGAVVQPN